jgi:hypothetical protein
MDANKPADKEKCRLEHKPCRSATRKLVYDNARICKRVVTKKCKEDPTKKKPCDISKRGISRLRKKELCSYIVSNPSFRSTGHVIAKDFEGKELKQNLSKSVQRQFFTPMTVNMRREDNSTIDDAARILYLAKYSGGQSGNKTIVYAEKGDHKAYWRHYDENEDVQLPEWELVFPDEFERYVRAARRRGIQNIFLNMRMFKKDPAPPYETSIHANFLMLDMKNNLMYRYEPSGYGLYDVFDMDELDRVLTTWARKRNLKYIAPWDSCPTQLFAKVAAAQRVAGLAKREEMDPGGFCKVWSTFMLEQKLRNPEVDMETLQKQLVKLFLDNEIDMTHFGRTYIQRVNQFGLKIMKEQGLKEEDPADFLETHWKKLLEAASR